MGRVSEFFETYAPYARKAAEATGLPPSLILVQWGHETGFGRGPTTHWNNLAGIKYVGQDEAWGERDGHAAYRSLEKFTDDYVRVMQLPFYEAVLRAGERGDVHGAIGAWGESPYAEDPDYTRKLRTLYDKYAPTEYDEDHGGKEPSPVPGGSYFVDGREVTVWGDSVGILPVVVVAVGLLLLVARD